MADPLVNILSLNRLTNSYSVFAPDQVLTFDQLNSVADYLNDQGRLTRVALLGVGIMAGLVAKTANATVTITRGLGVTTDADLLVLAADTEFKGFKPYGATSPKYGPLYDGDTMRTVYEIVPDPTGDELANPLSTFPANLADMVVVLLMESYQKDRNICTGTECDNLGKTAIDTPRFLLVSRADAAALDVKLSTVSAAAKQLDEVAADRAVLGAWLSTIGPFAAAYRAACKGIQSSLKAALPKLQANLPGIVAEVFGDDPTDGWTTALDKVLSDFAARDIGIQYLYDFLKDVSETWNAARGALADDDAYLLPETGAFPKHLLLGDLSDPGAFRTQLYPSPLVEGDRTSRGHARSLLRKLNAMIASFSLPTAVEAIGVTPSRTEVASLEDRAIPYYYAVRPDSPIQGDWNYRLARRGASASNLGYRAREYNGTAAAQNPLAFQIGRHDFFRVEGHLGRDVSSAMKDLNELVAARNLPLTVRAVLLHNDRKRLVFPPPGWRYGDLNRFHYLIRNEVALHLDDSGAFNEGFKAKVDTAIAANTVPDPDQQLAKNAKARHAEVRSAIATALPAMTTKSYTDYLANTDWKGAYKTAVNSSASFKSELGEVVRTDVSTPFDSLAVSNHAGWLDWLDTLIGAKNDTENDRLLFSNFIAAHPAFEHCGGVPRGGTFVLLYDDAGKVVGDGALPYDWPESAEAPPAEPELRRPDFKIPLLISEGIKVKPPIATVLDQFQTRLEPVWNAKIDMQKNYLQFFRDSVNALTPILVPKTQARVGAMVADPVLAASLDLAQAKSDQVSRLRELITRPDLSDDQRSQAAQQLTVLQADLAKSVVDTTQYVATTKADLSDTGDGSRAVSILAGIGGGITEATARDQLVGGLRNVQDATTGIHKAAIGNLVKTIIP